MKALVTGFEAWAGDANPASTIAKELNRKTIGGIEVVGVEVPEDFYRLPKLASRILKRVSPKVVLSLGWDLTSAIKVEKIAINVMASDFGGHVVPDNYNHRPKGEEIITGGPVAYRASLPAERIVNKINESGIPAIISYNAGTHCCNTLMYSFLHNTQNGGVMSGHIHIPPTPDMLSKRPNVATMSLQSEVKAIRIALQACAGYVKSTSS